MAHSNSDHSSTSLTDKEIKAPSETQRTKEEVETTFHSERKSDQHHRETHGQMPNDIDENSQISDIKGPNVFERAKEEIEAIVHTFHTKKESKSHTLNGKQRNDAIKAELKHENTELHSGKDIEEPNVSNQGKEKLEANMHKKKTLQHHQHRKETHGMSDDIDENTPISEVKGPSIFERAKEEIEALVQAINPKKESSGYAASSPSPKKEGGFRASVGEGLEKVCSSWGHKRD